MTVTINGTNGVTTPEVVLDNSAADGAQLVLKSSGYSDWNLDNYSGRLRGYYGSTEYWTVNASGNMGIGTGSPGVRADIVDNANNSQGQLRVSSSSSFGTRQTFVSTSTNGRTWQIGANFWIGNGEFSVVDLTANAQRMSIDSSGNLLVGTTSATAKLSVEQTSATNAINAYINYASSTNIAGIRVTKYDNNTTTSQRFVEFVVNAGATGCGQINANGANTAAFGSYSDERLKENIVDLPSQLSNILALRPVEFDYIGVEDGHQIGFIAQEMQQVYPDAVSVGNDEMLMITAWSKTEARLVKAIQEQQALIASQSEIINAQQAALTALTARVTELDTRLTSLEGTQP